MKHGGFGVGGGGRKNGSLPVFVLVLSIFLFAMFLYSEDFKSLAEFPFAKAPLRSQELIEHQHVISNPQPNHGKLESSSTPADTRIQQTGRKEKKATTSPKADQVEPEAPPVQEVQQEEAPDHDEELQEDQAQLQMVVDDGEDHAGIKQAEDHSKKQEMMTSAGVPENCDISDGEWVWDDKTHPLYQEDQCAFLSEQVRCMRNGRHHDAYQKWRWQPRGCSLPKFDGRLMLERLRGKRLMFIGDSLNRNQWESMVCLVQSAVPAGKKSLNFTGNFIIFRAEDYDATVEFCWTPFLVRSNSDDPLMHSIRDRIIMADTISKHAENWKGVDYLIFNTYIWWMNTGKMKVLREGSFDEGSAVYDEIDRPVAYDRVLRTWAKWVDENVDPKHTSVFFMSASPLHIKSTDWGNPDGIKCSKEYMPVMNRTQLKGVGTDRRLSTVATNVTSSMPRVPVTFIDITGLSELRKDAHTSVHTIRQGVLLSPEQRANPLVYADCIHWCLPGVPDTWNELLYARIMSS